MTTIDDFQIRLGTAHDIFEIAEVFADSVRELCKDDYEPDTIACWIASKSPDSRLEYINNKSLWVAEIHGKVVGYLISIPGEIIALFVNSSHTGLGIGIALGKLGFEIAKIGSGEVKLESTITAARFYKKLGFRDVGRGFYTHDQTGLKLPIINMVLSKGSSLAR